MKETVIKDSGSKKKFSTGSMRDIQLGKPCPDLAPTSTLLKLYMHYGNGACKYLSRNWEKGQPLTQYVRSAERHLCAFKLGRTDEPHLIAALWNIIALDWTMDMIEVGLLPEELDDRPEHMKENNPLGTMIYEMIEKNIEVMTEKYGTKEPQRKTDELKK